MQSLSPSEKDAGASPRPALADLGASYFLRYSSWQPLHAEPMPPTAFKKAPWPSLAAAARASARSLPLLPYYQSRPYLPKYCLIRQTHTAASSIEGKDIWNHG